MDKAAGPSEPPNPDPQDEGGYPESMHACLEAADEEYLAWLADHHWPYDEYLELEEEWRAELELAPAAECPGCGAHDMDVWPCGACGRTLHSGCREGMERRVVRPYRTRDMAEGSGGQVVAEWRCTGCSAVVGLDVS